MTSAIYPMCVIMLMSASGYLIILGFEKRKGVNPALDFLLWDWVEVAGTDLFLLVLIGGIASIGYYLYNVACLIACASQIVPFDYSFVFHSVFLAYLFFTEMPEQTLVGVAILVRSSLYVWYQVSIKTTQKIYQF